MQYNNGGTDDLHVDNTTGTARRGALIKWDLSSIPSNATVSSASLSLYVSDASSLVFNLYNMRRTWVEGISDRDKLDKQCQLELSMMVSTVGGPWCSKHHL